MDLHLSSRQTENISPLKILQYADLKIFLLFLVGPRRASLGRGKREERRGRARDMGTREEGVGSKKGKNR